VCPCQAISHLQFPLARAYPYWPSVRQQATTDDEQGRGLELLDGLIGLQDGARGVVDDSDGPGKTVYVAVSLAVTPANAS